MEGAVHFDNDVNNPLDTGFGYPNVAVGVYDYFAQQGPQQIEARMFITTGPGSSRTTGR